MSSFGQHFGPTFWAKWGWPNGKAPRREMGGRVRGIHVLGRVPRLSALVFFIYFFIEHSFAKMAETVVEPEQPKEDAKPSSQIEAEPSNEAQTLSEAESSVNAQSPNETEPSIEAQTLSEAESSVIGQQPNEAESSIEAQMLSEAQSSVF